MAGQPVRGIVLESGMTFDRQPTLVNDGIILRPLEVTDWDCAFDAASDPKIWELHPASGRHSEDEFRSYFHERLTSKGSLVILDRRTDCFLGLSSFGRHDEMLDEVEIGWTFLIRAVWGGATNRQVKELMLTHAFKTARTVSFRIAESNLRSRRATEKFGAVPTDRSHSIVFNGIAVPHVVYTITLEQFRASGG
jgi:N-acetyltransferase